MMDYDKLIEQLKCRGLSNGSALGYHSGLYEEAATAIETLQIENQALRNAANGFKADLARVTAERDAAIADIAAILAEAEEIRRGYGVDNADADIAFADLCGNYCTQNGHVCYKEAEDYRCKNFMWRGIKED